MSNDPSIHQRRAIEAPPEPVLVVAGPGAGKTFCLIRRVGRLIERQADPRRICALTFTNKAAEEIALRLRDTVGVAAAAVTRGTIHSLCLGILREYPELVGLGRGFGVADEAYQRLALGRLRVANRRRGQLLTLFGRRRLQGYTLTPDDERLFERYQEALATRNMIDFDDIIALTGRLFSEHPEVAGAVADSWDHVLVDEFQDLDRTQFDIVCRLALGHRSIFAVGDDEQSIFSWRGAEPVVLSRFRDRFGVDSPIVLGVNHRCSSEILAAARSLIDCNPSLFDKRIRAAHRSGSPVEAYRFPSDVEEAEWLLQEMAEDHRRTGGSWGDRAVLYRYHGVGERLEKLFLRAGIPCRLPRGRAMRDDAAIAFVVASLRLIARPGDSLALEGLARQLLPPHLVEEVVAGLGAGDGGFLQAMRDYARSHPRTDPDTRKAWRFIFHVENLAALTETHDRLEPLIDELLSHRVGPYRNPLEERYEELSDPESDDDTLDLARRIEAAVDSGRCIWVARCGGRQIALRRLLLGAGLSCPVRYLSGEAIPDPDDLVLDGTPDGTTVRLFKALQLVVTARQGEGPARFVCFDLETTGKDTAACGIIEIGAVRVVDGEIVDRYHRLMRPTEPIAPEATAVHGYSDADLAGEDSFEEVWPSFREFAGDDLLVAHNAHQFDVPVLRRVAAGLSGLGDLNFYDTLPLARSLFSGSARLGDLAERFGVPVGRAHHALDDAEALARVVHHLRHRQASRGRRSALANMLDYLALGIALEGEGARVGDEASGPPGEQAVLLDIARPAALGRYSDCLEVYAAERDALFSDTAPAVEEVIERLGGWRTMNRIRQAGEKDGRDRYPSAMSRILNLLEAVAGETLEEAIEGFLNLVALSTSEGVAADSDRVNLLTIHSTKGLEFSRVFIVGVEDYQFPGYRAFREGVLAEMEESRRLLYVAMTRARDRLVLTCTANRDGRPSGGTMFLGEMGIDPVDAPRRTSGSKAATGQKEDRP